MTEQEYFTKFIPFGIAARLAQQSLSKEEGLEAYCDILERSHFLLSYFLERENKGADFQKFVEELQEVDAKVAARTETDAS